MTHSISPNFTPELQYLLRLGDTCLILGQRLGEWCGHAPVLEEDIALTNMALDLIGQARGAAHARRPARRPSGARRRPARLPARRARLPQPDAGRTAARRLRLHGAAQPDARHLVQAALGAAARRRATPNWPAIAGKAVKEARYHQQHAADWVVRLGDGTDESRRRIERRAGRAVALRARDVRGRCGRRGGRGQRPGPGAQRRCARPGGAEMAAVLGEAGAARRRRPAPSAAPARGACTASTWATSWPRCSTCSAASPEARGDALAAAGTRCAHARLGRARRRARPRGAGAVGVRPGHRARRARLHGEGPASRSC